MQVTLTKIFRSDKDKNGNKLVSKQGKPYTKCAIKTQEHGEKWLSGFENKTTSTWKEGDTVEIEVTPNGEYLNFDTPKVGQMDTRALAFIKDDLNAIKTELQMVRGQFNEFMDYMKKNQVAFGSTKSSYPNPTPSEHNAMVNNNHFAGGLGYNTDDTGAQLEDQPF